ncbi:putative symporter YjmB [Oxobacter pfennigii]|uniref:Putative symporter YjmB n=1 Tax=Oxobacter pfennigii TaxID=36849 RepID=A0A0P8W6Q6_9CLOT|nr:glycoside-pentoside-hexuronide (GPH):cation symporter [Oxobacter pfennigii]KPU44399.1 putative symporter YjmB [Oxobacter pfennigii]
MLKEANQLNQVRPHEVDLKQTISYGLGFFGSSMAALGFGTYLTYFWTDIFIIPLAAISTIFMVSRFIDAITDLWCGFMVDRTNTKYGKARPWLLWNAVPAAISLLMLYFVPNFSETGKIVYAFITYNLVAFFYGTCISLPMQSLTSLMTSDPKKRLQLGMIGQAFNTSATVLGNMFVLKIIAALGGGAQGYFKFFGTMGVGAVILILITFIGTKENVVKDSNKNSKENNLSLKVAAKTLLGNKWFLMVTLLMALTMAYPALMSINMYYFTWNLKNPALMGPFMSVIFGAMLATLVLVTPVINRLGKIRAGFIGEFIQVLGGIIPLFAPGNVTVLMIAAACRGIGPAILLGTRLAFMCDVVEYGEWKTGVRIEGLIFSGASFGSKLGSGAGAAIITMMLGIGGYVGGAAAQSAEALSAIHFTFTWLHAIDSLLIAVCLFFLSGLDKQMPQIMEDLKARKALNQ